MATVSKAAFLAEVGHRYKMFLVGLATTDYTNTVACEKAQARLGFQRPMNFNDIVEYVNTMGLPAPICVSEDLSSFELCDTEETRAVGYGTVLALAQASSASDKPPMHHVVQTVVNAAVNYTANAAAAAMAPLPDEGDDLMI